MSNTVLFLEYILCGPIEVNLVGKWPVTEMSLIPCVVINILNYIVFRSMLWLKNVIQYLRSLGMRRVVMSLELDLDRFESPYSYIKSALEGN